MKHRRPRVPPMRSASVVNSRLREWAKPARPTATEYEKAHRQGVLDALRWVLRLDKPSN